MKYDIAVASNDMPFAQKFVKIGQLDRKLKWEGLMTHSMVTS
jgi:hypothetical protein